MKNILEEIYLSTKKLIAIDLDGTLLNNKGRVSEVTSEVITEIRDQGHKVVIATGRHTNSALPIAEQLQLTDAVVCFNGALVMDLEKNQAGLAHSYVQSDIKNLIELVREWGYGYITSTQHSYHIEPQFRHLMNFFTGIDTQAVETNSLGKIAQPILKTSIVGSEEEINQIERYVQPAIPHLSAVRSGEESIDVMSRKANKGAALQWLANYYQVKQEDTISFGNYYNDISMLKYAGTGVVVDNAPDQVKQEADIITYSNEENGVAQFLEEHLLRSVYARA